MKEFLSRILNKKVEKVEFLRSELNITNVLERTKTVDVLVLVDKKYIHIEMNAGFKKYLHYRNFSYFTSIYTKNTKRGDEIDPSIQFIHFDFTYGLSKDYQEVTEYHVVSDEKKEYISNFTIIEYNMDKIMNFWYHQNQEQIEKWKHLIMLDLEADDLSKISEGDKFMEEFKEKLNDLNDSEYFQSWMTLEEDRRLCANMDKKIAFEEGIEQGASNQQKEMALKMLKDNIDISLISKYTNLTEKEIKTL